MKLLFLNNEESTVTNSRAISQPPATIVVPSSKPSRWHSAASGCIAGAGARLVVAPLDLIRIRLQLEPNKNILTHIQHVSSESGVRGFFRGNVPATYLWMGYSAIQFSAYATVSEMLMAENSTNKSTTAFISGALAGVTATLTTYPLDICRTNFAARSATTAPETMLGFVKHMYKLHGLSGFFAGIGPALYGIVPYMGFNFLIYETLVGEKTPVNAGTAGAFAGATSKLLVYPLDTVKKRLQVQAYYIAEADHNKYKGMVDCFKRMLREEGPGSLYRGLLPSVLKNTIATSLSFAIYTKVHSVLESTNEGT